MSSTQYSVPIAEPITDVEGRLADEGARAVMPVDLPDGCYRLSVRPALGFATYRGTLRVDRSDGQLVVSGDLYRFPIGADEDETDGLVGRALAGATPGPGLLRRFGIPIHPRHRYHSYLKATSVLLVAGHEGHTMAAVTVEQYDYTQPPAGTFNGTFPAAPGSRTAVLRFRQKAAPSAQWPGNYYEGQWVRGGIVKGTITLGWVAPALRRCTIEVDTLVDAVSPQPVPGSSGSESFKTMMASAGWAATVLYNQTAVPVPATVPDHKACWDDAELHALMQSIRKTGADLDTEWRMHVLVVPGAMGCSRGKMYDQITVPREGVVSYSDDGYPSGDSANFGVAADQRQRDVPRAFLRSASHEVVHGFNQIHQEQEVGADNSIMTTTPSVADVLGSATSGDPGVFPDDIRLSVNANVRRHLSHFPDPVVRPGGHTFASWAFTPVPSADRFEVGPSLLALEVSAADDRVELGEPVRLSWELRNSGDADAAVPSEVTTESTYAKITVIDPAGRRREVAPLVISCERTRIAPLAAGASLRGESRVFWSTNGFAFERPGLYTVEVRVDWTTGGAPMTVRGETAVYVNYPTSDTDNEAAATLLHPEVGMWVALGGGAYHLEEAATRLRGMAGGAARASDTSDGGGPQVRALRGYEGILPTR